MHSRKLKQSLECAENFLILMVCFTLIFCLFLPSFSTAMGKDKEKSEETEAEPIQILLDEPEEAEKTEQISVEVAPFEEPEEVVTSRPDVSATVSSTKGDYVPVTFNGRWQEDNNYYDVPLTEEEQDILRAFCRDYNVSFPLMISLIQIESYFDPNCISHTNDYGLCQINECHMEWLTEVYGRSDYLDMYFSMECGTFLLSRFLDLDYTVEQALMCYNLSENGMLRKWNQGVTHTYYSDKIIKAFNELTVKF